jgi:WhiB family transcriptional regulator, redox-sensing transcriptional regulator
MTAWIDDQEPEPEEVESWQEYAACRGVDPELFFPARGGDTATPKAICAGCPVRLDCLEYAMSPPVEKFGIWGGVSERERRRIRSQRRSRPARTVVRDPAGNGHRFDGYRPHEVNPPPPKPAPTVRLLTAADVERMRDMRSVGMSLTEIADTFGCSRSVVHKRTKWRDDT